MKHVRRIIRMAHLFGAVSFALLLVACTDREATAPTALVDISKAQSLSATVSTSVESFDANGGPGRLVGRTFTQKVKAAPKGPGFMLVAPDTGGSYYDYEPLANTAPVLAVAYGQYWANIDETGYDSNGNLVRLVATGPADGSPISDVWAWVNGYPQVHMHDTWTAVSGGYVLSNQTITVVRSNYSRAVSLSSTVSAGYTMVSSNNNSLGSQFVSFSGKAFDKVGCWLSPQVAYASFPSGCNASYAVFAGETFVLGVGTVTLFPVLAPVSPLLASAYLAGWGLWTKSLYDVLACITNGRPHRNVVLPNIYGF